MACADGHGAHAGAARRLDAERRVFEDDAVLGRHVQPPRHFEKDRRLGLAGQALVAADDGVRRVVEREVFEREGDVVSVARSADAELEAERARMRCKRAKARDFAKRRRCKPAARDKYDAILLQFSVAASARRIDR